jgi:LysM repeat protein
MRKIFLFIAIFYSASLLEGRPPSGIYNNAELDEFRIELDDLKHGLNAIQVEVNLLDERSKKPDRSLVQSKDSPLFSSQVVALEKKISQLEKTLEKAANDLRSLNTTTSQALSKIQELENNFISHEKRLDDVVKLKGTLASISQAISQRSAEAPSSNKTYRVKAGDSLEKISRNTHISVETLKKINHLASDKIVVGQELRLADEP